MKPIAKFLTSAVDAARFPPPGPPEVAFLGRSNVGKSSLLNSLVGTTIARVSNTPGRTQMINFFALGDHESLVDLPGYGYARVPADIRGRWDKLLGSYLLGRHALRGLVIVVDARHGLMPLDRQMLEFFSTTEKPVHVLLTKADKLGRQQQARQQDVTQQQLAQFGPRVTAQLFSSVTGDGVNEARTVIVDWLKSHSMGPE